MRKPILNIIFLAAATAAAAVGCSENRGATTAGTLTPLRFADTIDAMKAELALSGKPMVINHWATWCGPCVDELPMFGEIYKKYEGKIDFRGVSWDRYGDDDDKNKITKEVDAVRARTGTGYVNIVAPAGIGKLVKGLELPAQSIPQTYVISRSGKQLFSIQREIINDSDIAAFNEALERAIAEK